MPLMPWRLSWATRTLSDAETRRRFFSVTSAHGTAGSLLLLLRCLSMAPRAGQTLERPVKLKVEGIGTIDLHSFSDFFIFFEVFVLELYRVPHEDAPKVIVDIGANTGMFSLYAHRSYPGARIVGYEPLPLNYERFSANLRKNGIRGVEAVNKGVGGTARHASLHLHPKNTGGHSLIAASLPDSSQAVEIEIVPIADVVASAGAPVDLMKIDCEGAEHEIIMAMTEEQARAIRLMIIEPSYKLYDKAAFLAKLEALGYDCRSHDDLLLAERRRTGEPTEAAVGEPSGTERTTTDSSSGSRPGTLAPAGRTKGPS